MSAFGTVGFAATDTHTAGFRRDTSQFDGAIDKPTGQVDTRLGVQLSAKLSETLLGTLQVVSRYRYDGTYKPEPTWACLAWNPVSNFQVRAGYLSFDYLPNGDFSNVGYTYLWVRPPVDVFGTLNLDRLRGVTANQTFALGGGFSLNVKLFGGETVQRAPVDHVGPWDLGGGLTWGATVRVAGGGWKGRVAYSYFRVPNNLPGAVAELQDALRGVGGLLHDPRLAKAADDINMKDRAFRTLQLGGGWERGPWQVEATASHVRTTSFLFPATWNGFVSFGYRVGEVVPYAMFSRVVSGRAARPDVGSLDALPAFYGPLVPAGKAIVASMDRMVAARGADQHTLSAGLRWDFADKADLKFQVDHIRAHNSTALMYNVDPYRPGLWNGKATVMSVTLDFILGGGR